MPLTTAEKSKRYREKIKNDPQKHEMFKKKELARQKKYQRKKKDLTEEEKAKKRERWREQKRKQKEKKKISQSNSKPAEPKQPLDNPKTSSSHSLKIRYKKLTNNYKRACKSISRYKTALETLRKKLYRLQKKNETEVNLLKTENDKLRARQETMEISLRDVYGKCQKPKQRLLLKRVVKKQEELLGKVGQNKILGLIGQIRIRDSRKKRVPKHSQEEIERFFFRDDISRCTAGKKETRTRDKKKMQIRYLVDTLRNIYKIYKKEGGLASFTNFYNSKPHYVLSPSINNRDTCMCIKHSNFDYLFKALKFKGVIAYKDTKELLNNVACDIKRYECMYNNCNTCCHQSITYDENKLDSEITWHKWTRIDHKYEKSGKVYVTKKTTKLQIQGTVREVIAEMQNALPAFKIHAYNWKEQQRQYRECINNLKDDEIVILCDFSENFQCKYSNEIQSMHFGASKNCVTLHCGVIFWKSQSQSFVTISDDNCHEPNAIWAHLIPVIKFAREKSSHTIKVIHFFSDGPSSQYRQKKNFYLLSLFTSKWNLSHSTWSFSESGHGKSMADGIGGSVKRQLDKRISYGHDVTNGTEAFQILQSSMKTVKCFYISDQDIKNMNKLIPEGIKAVPGTMQLHQISCAQDNQIKYRPLSCFCGELRGLCDCLSPKVHNIATNKIAPASCTTALKQLKANIDFNDGINLTNDNILVSTVNISQPCTPPQEPDLDICSFDSLREDDLSRVIDTLEMSSVEPLIEITSTLNLFECIDSDLIFPFPELSNMKKSPDHPEYRPQNKKPKLEAKCNPTESPEHPQHRPHHEKPKLEAKCNPTESPEHPQYRPHHKKPKLEAKCTRSQERNKVKNVSAQPKCGMERSSRTFPCHVCKKRLPFNISMMVKCMVCKNWTCTECSNTTFFDYICPICLDS